MRAAALLVAALVSFSAHAERLSPRQIQALNYAAIQGSQYDETLQLQGIIFLEASACQLKGGSKRASLGCGQIQLKTAKSVARRGESVSVTRLVSDDRFNISLSARYLHWCIVRFHSRDRGIVCYRRGPEAARTWTDMRVRHDPYLKALNRFISHLGVSYD